MFNPKFNYTNSMVLELMSIEHSRAIVDLMPLPATVERDLIEKAKVKMTHYSTRIEGNLLDLEQVSRVVKQKPEKNRIAAEDEVRNHWEALSFLSREKKKRLRLQKTLSYNCMRLSTSMELEENL